MTIEDKTLDEKAMAWVNAVVPRVFKSFEEDLKIPYCDEAICLLMHDAFTAGYKKCLKDLAEKKD